jgi:uncharacterized protein YcbX
LWRYPVKSMLGEELNASNVTERGLAGDRAYALVDSADGKIASAKNPRQLPRMFQFRAALAATADLGDSLPAGPHHAAQRRPGQQRAGRPRRTPLRTHWTGP